MAAVCGPGNRDDLLGVGEPQVEYLPDIAVVWTHCGICPSVCRRSFSCAFAEA
jgi:hypothetical protein